MHAYTQESLVHVYVHVTLKCTTLLLTCSLVHAAVLEYSSVVQVRKLQFVLTRCKEACDDCRYWGFKGKYMAQYDKYVSEHLRRTRDCVCMCVRVLCEACDGTA